jgi:hypothetical protein
MGKHERDIVEKAEIIVASLMMNKKISSLQKKHPFIDLIKKFVKNYKENSKNIHFAEAIGNSYKFPGDIMVNFRNGVQKYIELKFLKERGVGTLANISQDALTLLGIYNCQSWSSFRKETKHRDKVIKFLNKFKYPFGKILLSDPNSKIYKAASYLKEIIKAGNLNVEGVCKKYLESPKSSKNQKIASNIILEVIKMDKSSRREYLSILKKSNLNKDRLKKFVFLLLTGDHTQKILNTEINKDFSFLKRNINDYEIYYLYKKTQEIKKENNLDTLYKIFNKNIDIEIKEGNTNLVIFSIDKGKRTNLIRIVYHWKNKFGGIETPCLNVFDMTSKSN